MNIQITQEFILGFTIGLLCIIDIVQGFKIRGHRKGLKFLETRIDDLIEANNKNIKKVAEQFKDMTTYIDDHDKNVTKDLTADIITKTSGAESKIKQLADTMSKGNKLTNNKLEPIKPGQNSEAELTGLKKRISLTEDEIKKLNQKIRKS
jgi:predicted  nucleic acid-binding Zn-ribbon protein